MLFPDGESAPAGRSRTRLALALVAALGVVGGGLWWWLGQPRPEPPGRPPLAIARLLAPLLHRSIGPRLRRRSRVVQSRLRRRREVGACRSARGGARARRRFHAACCACRATSPGRRSFSIARFIGTTPLEKAGLDAGSHRLNVSAEGYEGIAQTVEIGDQPADVTVRFKEVRLDAAVPVVHKHGMGSCEGRLVATVQGLRYETANRGDAFEVPLDRLQGFEVDYLKKNLRVRLAGGKTYNFAEPAGQRRRALRLPSRRGKSARAG